MSPEQVFSIFNAAALAAWLLLATFPRRPVIVRTILGTAVPALFAVAYAAILAVNWSSSEGGFSSLGGVGLLFSNPWVLLAGWTHYLAFDLLVGVWEVTDAGERGIPHLLVVPCLALTFMFGPAGWLVYQMVRRGFPSRRTASLQITAA
jgi:hypothetical protein